MYFSDLHQLPLAVSIYSNTSKNTISNHIGEVAYCLIKTSKKADVICPNRCIISAPAHKKGLLLTMAPPRQRLFHLTNQTKEKPLEAFKLL